ncbi:hypothetical protein, partial [Pantoea septica]|uniref:hypothetical protein n=1 Tax=Pantoea septica TaxID=472695 RepID=UPI00289D9209
MEMNVSLNGWLSLRERMYSIKLALKTVTYLYFEAVAYSRSTNIKSGLEMNAYVYLRRIYASGQRKRPKAR